MIMYVEKTKVRTFNFSLTKLLNYISSVNFPLGFWSISVAKCVMVVA